MGSIEGTHSNIPLRSSADLHTEVIQLVCKEVERLGNLSQGKNEAKDTSLLAVQVCRFVDKCINTGKLTSENYEKTIAYNVPFWTQALLKDIKTRLELDEWAQALYPVNSKHFPLIPLTHNPLFNRVISLIPESIIWKYILKNYPEVQGQYDALRNKLSEIGAKKVLFVGNHATWLNHPISAYFLTSTDTEAPPIDTQALFTIAGPAIMTNLLTRVGATLRSSVLKTWPDTPRGNTSFPFKNKVRANFGKSIKDILQKERVYCLLSPSGTTDEYRDGMIHIAKPSDGTMELIQSFIAAGFTIIVIGTNDLKIMKRNAKIQPGEAHVRWEICESRGDIMSKLATCVVGANNRQIGQYSI